MSKEREDYTIVRLENKAIYDWALCGCGRWCCQACEPLAALSTFLNGKQCYVSLSL